MNEVLPIGTIKSSTRITSYNVCYTKLLRLELLVDLLLLPLQARVLLAERFGLGEDQVDQLAVLLGRREFLAERRFAQIESAGPGAALVLDILQLDFGRLDLLLERLVIAPLFADRIEP